MNGGKDTVVFFGYYLISCLPTCNCCLICDLIGQSLKLKTRKSQKAHFERDQIAVVSKTASSFLTTSVVGWEVKLKVILNSNALVLPRLCTWSGLGVYALPWLELARNFRNPCHDLVPKKEQKEALAEPSHVRNWIWWTYGLKSRFEL